MIDLIGKRFYKLVVIKMMGLNKNRKPTWLCLCDCGNEKIILENSLKSGNTKSCGCWSKECHLKHGHRKDGKISKIYRIWNHMIQRCDNPKNTHYKYYGGRDKPILVCERWLDKKNGFENFYKDVGDPPKGKTLDRINNNRGYFPNNWKWSTMKQQSRNKRNNKFYTYKHKTQILKDWAKEYNIKYTTLWHRLYQLKLSIEEALTTPIRKYKRKGEQK